MTTRSNRPDTEADRQVRASLARVSPSSFRMVAGAGSGKTTSLVKALSHVRDSRGAELRKRGQKVACITYTEAAAAEILTDVGNDDLFHVSTIHSFLWTVIRPFQKDIHAWVVNRIQDKLNELREKASAFGPRVQSSTRERNRQEIKRYEETLAQVPFVARFDYGVGSDYLRGILGHDDIIKMVPDHLTARSSLRLLVAQKYPIVLVDESQDTSPIVVEALKAVQTEARDRFALGFFGDPMQKIYATGVGEVVAADGWRTITKPENFRCPDRVLTLINKIREEGDGLIQTSGRNDNVEGTARLFILPADERRSENLAAIRRWISAENNDPLWARDDNGANVRVLVIVHRMAANRLGFPNLYAALNDGAPESFRERFLDGTLWALNPFTSYLLPLAKAHDEGKHFEEICLLRAYCPLLFKQSLPKSESMQVLRTVSKLVVETTKMLAPGTNSKVREVLKFVDDSRLAFLDERFSDYLADFPLPAQTTPTESTAAGDLDDGSAEETAMLRYFDCRAAELWGYLTYVRDESPFWTHQGVKGTEFDRVLCVLDDDEGRHVQFSYNKYFGIAAPSQTDKKNRAEGKETVIDRTRRLFYVCCSRAVKDLAVVFFADDVKVAEEKLRAMSIFPQDQIRVITRPIAEAPAPTPGAALL